MALAEVIYGCGLRALAGAARVGKVYFRPHGAGVTIGVFQRIPAAFAKHQSKIFEAKPSHHFPARFFVFQLICFFKIRFTFCFDFLILSQMFFLLKFDLSGEIVKARNDLNKLGLAAPR